MLDGPCRTHTTAEPRRYNIITTNKLASTLYPHLIMNLKFVSVGSRGITNAHPRFVRHGKHEASDNESRERVSVVLIEGLSYPASIKATNLNYPVDKSDTYDVHFKKLRFLYSPGSSLNGP